MTYEVIISSEAQLDILEILEFAAVQSPRYVRNFNTAFDELVARLERFPKYAPVAYKMLEKLSWKNCLFWCTIPLMMLTLRLLFTPFFTTVEILIF